MEEQVRDLLLVSFYQVDEGYIHESSEEISNCLSNESSISFSDHVTIFIWLFFLLVEYLDNLINDNLQSSSDSIELVMTICDDTVSNIEQDSLKRDNREEPVIVSEELCRASLLSEIDVRRKSYHELRS